MKSGGKLQSLLREAGVDLSSGNSVPPRPVSKDPGRYRDRIADLPGAAAIADKTVIVVGLGSVGSEIAARLARLGTRVVGCDPDVLAVENLVRWGLPASIDQHVGLPKARVWQDMLAATVPGARVQGHVLDVVLGAAEFDALVAETRPALLVAATDTADSRRMVNAMAARHGVPALFVALSDGAASVRIEFVEDARRGPCHLCAARAEGAAEPGRRSRLPYGTDAVEDSHAIAVTALPIDVALGALLGARAAVQLLAGEDVGEWFRNGEQQGNVLFVSLQSEWWLFEAPLDRFVYQVERDPDCPACGHVPVCTPEAEPDNVPLEPAER